MLQTRSIHKKINLDYSQVEIISLMKAGPFFMNRPGWTISKKHNDCFKLYKKYIDFYL